jgi:hypothetical protein
LHRLEKQAAHARLAFLSSSLCSSFYIHFRLASYFSLFAPAMQGWSFFVFQIRKIALPFRATRGLPNQKEGMTSHRTLLPDLPGFSLHRFLRFLIVLHFIFFCLPVVTFPIGNQSATRDDDRDCAATGRRPAPFPSLNFSVPCFWALPSPGPP